MNSDTSGKVFTFALKVIVFFALAFLFFKIIGGVPFYVNSVNTEKTETFQMTGTGDSSAIPDEAVVTVGVTANGSTVAQAQQTLNTNINKISDAIKGLGVAASDIQTQNYNISPNYDFTNGQRITGYNASSNLVVNVKDLAKVNDVIDTSTSNGANQVGGVSFQVSDPTAAENEAREEAVAEAKKNAEAAAAAAGFTLGKIINYSESFGGLGGPFPTLSRVENLAGDAKAPTEIEPGSTEINATVTLSYEIL